MSNPETVLVALLEADSGWTALAGARLYDTRAPQNTARPYAIFQLVDDIEDRHLAGRSGLHRARYQFDFYADSKAEARALAAAANPALEITSRRMVAGLDVRGIIRLDMRDLDDGAATQLYRRSVDYQITWRE